MQSFGCGVLLRKSWFALRWPKIENLPYIAILELVPIVLAASVRGQLWSLQHIPFNCDNLAVVHVLQTKTSRDSHLLKLLRNLTILPSSSILIFLLFM